MTRLQTGDQAPDFDLPSDGSERLRLSEFRGKSVAIFFYPKDDTSACTQEAIDFNQLRAKFRLQGVAIIGISPDSPKAHKNFKLKHDLKIHLAADEERATLLAYDVWHEKSLYGRKYMGVVRTSFLIDGEGVIRQIWWNLRVKGHAQAVLDAAKALK